MENKNAFINKVLTLKNDPHNILRNPSQPLFLSNWDEGRQTYKQLLHIRENLLKGGAGLAAPQIGLSQQIFIYTPDRTTENLRAIVNPSFEPLSHHVFYDWEACFSLPLCAILVPRWYRIKVRFYDLCQNHYEEILEGFEARVFQHEYDHLQGRLMIDYESVCPVYFSTKKEFNLFLSQKQYHLQNGFFENTAPSFS
jgi:peptide deformylase